MVTPIPPPCDDSRIASLDGLRGIAAVIVMLGHFVLAFTPVWYAGTVAFNWSGPNIAAKTPLFVLQSGTFAVFVFFALSGFVMAQSGDRSRAPLLALAGTRLLRLNIPVAASIALAVVLLAIFPNEIHDVAAIVRHGWVQGWYQPGGPSLLEVAIGLARGSYRAAIYYNPVVWTMRVELIGSLVIYTIYKAVPARYVVPCLVAGLVFTFFRTGTQGFLFGFFSGALLYTYWSRGHVPRSSVAWVVFLIGTYLGGFPFAEPRGPSYQWLADLLRPIADPELATRNAGAILVLIAMLYLPGVRAVFSMSIPGFLGRISFALYLTHFPILCTMVAATWLWIGPDHQFLLFLAFVALTVSVAWVMTVVIDEPMIRRLSRIRRWSQSWRGPVAFGARPAATQPSKSG
ncbi:peptidoglycan/LPS O-acetylase OafA/YrhL [Tepidamorphus gemmatus]|uniref:Peptidoglycan/LPS O-acetylase OafA/YrhL n=1 Tax=Tepidamorphus gemmatus TaxID=747076 RepID=A0A4R3MAU7_9HYPH|nr:acyltransferase [Tepidamorphus gemmatus]TCT09833.1 peptidoglycan/LPS O-acetylase OafA/YrhL [Tepidamorphus gemmatus]